MSPKMTAKEKAERAKIKKQLQEQGFIPHDKNPLNREKFIREARSEFDESFKNDSFDFLIYLLEAVQVMITHGTLRELYTMQAVGAAKALKIAVRMK